MVVSDKGGHSTKMRSGGPGRLRWNWEERGKEGEEGERLEGGRKGREIIVRFGHGIYGI